MFFNVVTQQIPYLVPTWTACKINNYIQQIKRKHARKKYSNYIEDLKSLILTKIKHVGNDSDKKLLMLAFIHILCLRKEEYTKKGLVKFNFFINFYYYNDEQANLKFSENKKKFIENKLNFYVYCCWFGYFNQSRNINKLGDDIIETELNRIISTAHIFTSLVHYGYLVPYYITFENYLSYSDLNNLKCEDNFGIKDCALKMFDVPIQITEHIMEKLEII